MKISAAILFALSLCCVTLNAYADKEVVLSSLDWPPYTGQELADGGASAAVAKAAFKAMGYTLKIEFYPWSRAVDSAKNDPRIMGYFPEYYSDDVKNAFYMSDPMGNGPLGFAQHVGAGVTWNSIPDLSRKTIGVVQDYVNTKALDDRIANKSQPADFAVDDTKNLVKLVGQRIDLAVVDSNVFNYLMNNDPQLKGSRGQLEMNKKLLENKKLYICFKHSPDGDKYKKIFNAGLKKIDVQAIMNQYLKQ